MQENYKGFVVDARSFELKDDMGWDSRFDLVKHDGAGVTVTPFTLEATFKTEAEAIAAALAHGRKRSTTDFQSDLLPRRTYRRRIGGWSSIVWSWTS
jgi:hypothetical protein